MSLHLCICLFVCLPACLCLSLSVCLSLLVCLSVCLSSSLLLSVSVSLPPPPPLSLSLSSVLWTVYPAENKLQPEVYLTKKYKKNLKEKEEQKKVSYTVARGSYLLNKHEVVDYQIFGHQHFFQTI